MKRVTPLEERPACIHALRFAYAAYVARQLGDYFLTDLGYENEWPMFFEGYDLNPDTVTEYAYLGGK